MTDSPTQDEPRVSSLAQIKAHIHHTTQRVKRITHTLRAHVAIWAKNTGGLRRALAQGANPDARYNRNDYFLHRACRTKWLAGSDLLLQAGANPELKTQTEQATALFVAAQVQSVELIELLMQHGADLDGTGVAPDSEEFFAALEYFGFQPPQGLTSISNTQTARKLIRVGGYARFGAWKTLQEARQAKLTQEDIGRATPAVALKDATPRL